MLSSPNAALIQDLYLLQSLRYFGFHSLKIPTNSHIVWIRCKQNPPRVRVRSMRSLLLCVQALVSGHSRGAAAIFIHSVSGDRGLLVHFLHPATVVSLIASSNLCFRLKPSTFGTIWTPYRDSQAPSDSNVLHHQQRWGPGRVSNQEMR